MLKDIAIDTDTVHVCGMVKETNIQSTYNTKNSGFCISLMSFFMASLNNNDNKYEGFFFKALTTDFD